MTEVDKDKDKDNALTPSSHVALLTLTAAAHTRRGDAAPCVSFVCTLHLVLLLSVFNTDISSTRCKVQGANSSSTRCSTLTLTAAAQGARCRQKKHEP